MNTPGKMFLRMCPMTPSRSMIIVVLVWDCCPAHLQDHVIALARRFKIRLPLVPARLTWLLSPCDLMLFLMVKRQIKLEWQKEVFAQGSNNLDCGTWVLLVSRAIHDVIHCSWDKAFRLAGITTTGVIPSASIEKHLGMSKLDPISPDMPTASSLSCILPRNRKLDMGRLLWWNAAPDRAQSAIPDLVALAREARTLDWKMAMQTLEIIVPAEAAVAVDPPPAGGAAPAAEPAAAIDDSSLHSELSNRIHDLRAERASLAQTKKNLTKQIKAAVRRKSRMVKAAKRLSSSDLKEILAMRGGHWTWSNLWASFKRKLAPEPGRICELASRES